MTYQHARNLFSTCRFANQGKPLGSNVRLWKQGDNFHISHHRTDIIILKPDGSQILSSGGWYSVTTKQRLNLYSNGYVVFSHKGQWRIVTGIWGKHVEDLGTFYDGIEIDPYGRIVYSELRNVHCLQCKKLSFTNAENLLLHLELQHDLRGRKCVCGQGFRTKLALAEHLASLTDDPAQQVGHAFLWANE